MVIKKYIIGASISFVLLLVLFLFSDNGLNKSTGNLVYFFPEDLIVFDIIKNDVPNYFCSSENKFSGNLSFKIREGVILPANSNAVLLIKNSGSYTDIKTI